MAFAVFFSLAASLVLFVIYGNVIGAAVCFLTSLVCGGLSRFASAIFDLADCALNREFRESAHETRNASQAFRQLNESETAGFRP